MSSGCLHALEQVVPGKVFTPESEEYKAQQSTYYSSEQASLLPLYRVSPTTSQDVANIVRVLIQHSIPFAVRSGGHMTWKGASNIGSTGATIDLQRLNQIVLSDDMATLSVGPGATWGDVYAALSPHGLAVVGARSSGVGVGGFLMGGGLSFLSVQHGLGSDNVINYEAVLVDGTIVNANPSTNSDLYWALKLGSTNFAIVTRFDLATKPLGQLWGGSMFYDISEAAALMENLVTVTRKLPEDPTVMTGVGLAYAPSQSQYVIWVPTMCLEPRAFPSILGKLTTTDPLLSTMRLTSLLDLTNELHNTTPKTPNGRVIWNTLTLRLDHQLPLDIFLAGKELFESCLKLNGFQWAIFVQPIDVGMIKASQSRNGGNPFGLSAKDGDKLLYVASVQWSDQNDDDVCTTKAKEFMGITENMARSRNMLHGFVYANYAHGNQDVYGGIGDKNLQRMKGIQRKYDEDGLFNKYWNGGWKLN